MSFRSMTLLWLLAIVPFALAMFLGSERTRTAIARRFTNERLRGGGNPLRALRPWLLTIALAAALLAVAGPYAGFKTVPVIARESNRVIVLDVSNSMAAEDVGTSRLAASKALAKEIVNAQPGRIGLVVFEATPSVIAPLTSDSDAVTALLDTLIPGEVGEPGSDIGSAILAAMQLVEADPAQSGDIVIISDGEEQGVRVPDAIQRAKSRGVKVSAIVVGSAQGAPIPTPDGPLRDGSGNMVTTFARADTLQQLARGTGGALLQNPFGADALAPLFTGLRAGAPQQTEVRVPVDRYQWPLALAFFALFAGSLVNRGAE
ncbi:MAG TPA: VWA domain-containing protein [Thermoanaerobaculia bacterium]|jgi:Ca-activated chloride channel family protein